MKPRFEGVPAERSRIMRANRRIDTGPERALRSELHRRGMRFRVDYPIDVPGARPIRPDVAFPRARLAIFVDGCFWHACPIHATQPVQNSEYWRVKLDANRRRDARQTAALKRAGWRVVRVWEHEPIPQAALRIAGLLERREPDFR